MLGSFTPEFLEDLAVVVALLTSQFITAGYAVFTSHLMTIGLHPLFLVILNNTAVFAFLFPLAICFERKLWPREFSVKLLGQLVLLSFIGVTVFQTLILNGVKKTSPAVASAMPNLAPGFIFCMAWAFRLEEVNLKCIYSVIKVVGTLICIVGAITMSFLHDYSSKIVPEGIRSHEQIIDENKVMGTTYLLVAVIVLSGSVVLQASTLGDLPAPISLSAVTAGFGSILTVVMQIIQEHKFTYGSKLVTGRDLVGYALMAGVVSGLSTSLQTWAMKKKGPVYVSMFNPVGTVFSVILSTLSVGDSITLGSLIGMLLMFSGLYFVLWAKKKELYVFDEESTKSLNEKTPLLR